MNDLVTNAIVNTELIRAKAMAAASLGKVIKIRTQKATRSQSGVVVTGKIVRCEPGDWRHRGMSKIRQFRVWLEGRTEMFVVEGLPR